MPPARLNPAHAARPGNHLPEVFGKRPTTAVRQCGGAGRRPASFRTGRAHQGPSRWTRRSGTCRWARRRPALAGALASGRAAGIGPRCHRSLVARAADGARGDGRGIRRGRPERVGATAGQGGVQGLGRRAATGQGPAGRICSAGAARPPFDGVRQPGACHAPGRHPSGACAGQAACAGQVTHRAARRSDPAGDPGLQRRPCARRGDAVRSALRGGVS